MPWPLDNEPAADTVESTSTWWTVKTYYKKSCEQHEVYVHDDYENPIRVQEGFRWAEFLVETTDGNPPEFVFKACPGGTSDLDSVDLNSCFGDNVDSTELRSLDDGCWREIEWPKDMEDDERERLEAVIDEEGAWALEDEEGWTLDETEVWAWGPIEITNDEGYRRIIVADEHGQAQDFKEELQ